MSDDFSEMSDDELWREFETAENFEKGQILFHLHHRRIHEGEYNTALAMAEQARDIYANLDSTRELGMATQFIGNALSKLEDYLGAIDVYRQAASIYLSCGADFDTAWCEKYIGDCHWYLKDYVSAYAHYESSIKIFESIDHVRGMEMAAEEMGEALFRLGKYQESLHTYELAIKHAIACEATTQIFNAHRGAIDVALAIGDTDKALNYAERIFALGMTCTCKVCEFDPHLLLGRALLESGQIPQAFHHLEIAKNGYLERSDTKKQISPIVELAYCEMERNPGKARKMFEHAQTLVEMFPSQIRPKIRLHVGLGLLAQQRGELEAAKAYFDIAHEAAAAEPRFTADRHRMLPNYLDVLSALNEHGEILLILEQIESENGNWCIPDELRFMHQAQTYFILGRTDEALTIANEGIYHAGTSLVEIEAKAHFHELRGRILLATDQHEANRSFQNAMAYYLQIGRPDLANAVGEFSVVEPEQRHQEELDEQADHDAYEELFGCSDPIIEQHQDDLDTARIRKDLDQSEGSA